MSEKLHPDVEEVLRYNRDACKHELLTMYEKVGIEHIRFDYCKLCDSRFNQTTYAVDNSRPTKEWAVTDLFTAHGHANRK